MRALLENKIILIISTIVLILSFIITPFLASADFNQQINYQGKLTNSAGVAVADGTYNMKFWLIASSTAATSTAVWAETRIGGDKVQVTNGLFSVMLGEVTSLASVDFNQTLYLGVEIGGSGSPTWDGEMTPRKILGAVPAAFEAENAQTLAGIATTSFLRSDTIDTMEATSSSALLTLIQNGAGKILSLFSGATEMFTVLSNGNVGIATTTPSNKLTVAGDINISDTSNGYKIGNNLVLYASSTNSSTLVGIGAGQALLGAGSYNTAIGHQALLVSTSSLNNTAVGAFSLSNNTTGSYNTANGEASLTSNTTGSYNTANGEASMFFNSTGSFNTANGAFSLYNNNGDHNTANGYRSLYSNTTGSENTALGYYSGRFIANGVTTNTAPNNSVFLGFNTKALTASDINQIVIGHEAIGNGSNSVTLGNTSITKTILQGNIGIATTTPSEKLTVVGNTYLGGGLTLTGALKDSTSATGTLGMILKTTGTSTQWVATSTLGLGNGTFLGLTDTPSSFTANRLMFTNSGATALTDSANLVFDGTNFGIGSTTPSSKLTVAGSVDVTNTATSSPAITLRDTIGGISLELRAGTSTLLNTFVGVDAGKTNTTGSDNTANGHRALFSNTSGSDNSVYGFRALYNNTTGSNNTALGSSAGRYIANGVTGNDISSNSLYLGYNTKALADGGTNEIVIGYTAVGAGSNTVTLGSTTITSTVLQGNIGIATTTPSEKLTVVGNTYLNGGLTLTGALKDSTSATGTLGMVLQTTGTSTQWVATSSLGISGVSTFLGLTDTPSSFTANRLMFTNSGATALTDSANLVFTGTNLGIGTTTPGSSLAIEKLTFTGAGIAGINQNLKSTNVTASAVQYGNYGYLYASNTATTTIAGNMFKIEDNTLFGNTVRGFEVQTDRGTNTLGENTALSGFARTFGVRGTTQGDAGGTYEPAGIFAETLGTTQGNAIRGYSSSITTASLLKLFQASSTFNGVGLLMNFGNSGGSFSSTTASKFIDLQNAGTSMFTVGAYGKLTIGDGTTNNNAGIQVGYGGICVDNDGSCNASTTGRISAVSYHTGNSDLAETYFSNENLKAGEVVYIKEGLSIGRAEEINKDKIIGVVSTKPGLLLGFDDTSLKSGEKSYPIALKGRVPVRLSNENGEIKAGDELMLSSVAGVVMKATSTGKIVGLALEDFDGSRAYSDTYINQFGDDLVDPVFTPINHDLDPRINDGCYFGGGNASGEEPCVPLMSTTTDGQIAEAEAIARREAEEKALASLALIPSETVTLENGQSVKIGQVVMFVELRNRSLDEVGTEMMVALMAKASSTDDVTSESVWQRIVKLANNFVDGVLSIFTLKADRVEVKNELCVDGVCINADDLRQILETGNNNGGENNQSYEEETEEDTLEENIDEPTEDEVNQIENNNIEEPINEETAEESEMPIEITPQDSESNSQPPEVLETTPETTPETPEVTVEEATEEINEETN